MSSRGIKMTVPGTTGADYTHREQVAAHYQLSVLYKSRLRWCMLWHWILFLAMLLRLSADILDRLDVFILEIEQLQIPEPNWCEYMWLLSVLSFVVLNRSLRRNDLVWLKRWMICIVLTGVVPMIAIAIYAAYDDRYWQSWWVGGISLWWSALALQLHSLQSHAVFALSRTWRNRSHTR